MMKSSLILATLFQVFQGLVAFAPASMRLLPSTSTSVFRPLQTTLVHPQWASAIPMEPMVDVAVARPALSINPWDRVCATVSTTADQVNALRHKLAKQGVATAISYSFVSNAFTSVAVSLAWYGFSVQTGMSPISPGQWKPFLAWYGGFYAINSLLKPVRFMVALGVVPHTEKIMASLQAHFDDSKKASVACTTALLLVTSGTMMASAIGLSSLLSGVPILPGAPLV